MLDHGLDARARAGGLERAGDLAPVEAVRHQPRADAAERGRAELLEREPEVPAPRARQPQASVPHGLQQRRAVGGGIGVQPDLAARPRERPRANRAWRAADRPFGAMVLEQSGLPTRASCLKHICEN